MSRRPIPNGNRLVGRTAVYDAEDHVFGAKNRAGLALSDAAVLVARYAPSWVVVRGRSRTVGSSALRDERRILLGRRAGLPVVLHELAHALTPNDRGHGRAFRQTYVDLVAVEMSPWWARRLRRAFREVGYIDDRA